MIPPTAFEVATQPTKINDFVTRYTYNVNTNDIPKPITNSYLNATGYLPNYYNNYEQYLEAMKPKN